MGIKIMDAKNVFVDGELVFSNCFIGPKVRMAATWYETTFCSLKDVVHCFERRKYPGIHHEYTGSYGGMGTVTDMFPAFFFDKRRPKFVKLQTIFLSVSALKKRTKVWISDEYHSLPVEVADIPYPSEACHIGLGIWDMAFCIKNNHIFVCHIERNSGNRLYGCLRLDDDPATIIDNMKITYTDITNILIDAGINLERTLEYYLSKAKYIRYFSG